MASAFHGLLNLTWWMDMQGILVFLGVVLLVKYLSDTRPKNLPPGPLQLPIIGNLLDISFRDPIRSFEKIYEKYGGVSTLYLANQDCVLLSGYNSFKEAFVEQGNIFSDRASYPLNDRLSRGLGLISSSGHMWRQQRRFVLSTLKNFGMGKKILENSVLQESRYLCEALHSHQGLPFDPHHTLTSAVANIICSLVFGHRFEYDDHYFHKILQYSDEVFQLPMTSWGRLYNKFPTLVSWLPGRHQTAFTNLSKLKRFIQEEIQKHKQDRNPDNPRDYIDCYLEEIETCKDSQAEFTEENLVWCVVDLFGAGTETTFNTLRWAMLYMAKYPSVQEKVQAEIDQVIGQTRPPSMDDRSQMPYTYAVTHEIQRFSNIVPFTPPRVANEDTTVAGYLIPKGMMILPFLNSILQDQNEFSTPDEFNPEHFLDENGRFVKKENFIPFSIGKRMCPGEQLARMELFIFFTSLMQRFTFHAPEGQTLGLERTVGITSGPRPFRIRAVPR
ncbi:cytochrome P450 2J6 [Pygocentrus nattereri]|uniref:cytochrome P450 2J6 n=1 Tax=Pygocentrus nattereri TaxID=42514 RepID=UPI0008145FEF|nr:cytochrome P450 2J6 [Pygocentrus nattereri]